jgi:hypothetical protein
MNDRQIEQLLKMAHEIEMLEASDTQQAGVSGRPGSAVNSGGSYVWPSTDASTSTSMSASAAHLTPSQRDRLAQERAFILSAQSGGALSLSEHKLQLEAKARLEGAAELSRKRWRGMFTAAAVVLLAGLSWQMLTPLLSGRGANGNGPATIRQNFDIAGGTPGSAGSSSVLADAQRGPDAGKKLGPSLIKASTGDAKQAGDVTSGENVTAAMLTIADPHTDPDCNEYPGNTNPLLVAGNTAAPVNHEGMSSGGVGSRIITFSLDSSSDCRCSKSVLRDWDAHASAGAFTEVSRSELLRLGFESSCISEPDRVMVVSVTGPIDELPTSDEDIAALVSCVDPNSSTDEEIGYLGHDEVDYKSAAMQCLSHGLKVEVATLLAR